MYLFKWVMVTALRIGHETVSSCFGTRKIAPEVVKLLTHIDIGDFRKIDGLLLPRTHLTPFAEAGIPAYIRNIPTGACIHPCIAILTA